MPPKKSTKVKKKELSKTGEEADKICQRFLKSYESTCAAMNCLVSPSAKDALKQGMEDAKFVRKLIVEPVPFTTKDDPRVMLEPLLSAMRKERYNYIKSLHVWQIPLTNQEMTALGLLLDKAIYDIVNLDLMDTMIQPYGVQRVARSFTNTKSITKLSLDYNEFGDDGCGHLCAGLAGNVNLLHLSLNYCGITEKSAKCLSVVISTTAISEVLLDGNDLGCTGVEVIVKPLVAKAEEDVSIKRELLAAQQAAEEKARLEEEAAKGQLGVRPKSTERDKAKAKEKKEDDKKKKGKKGKKKGKDKGPPLPPPVGAILNVLHIADNGIDSLDRLDAEFLPLQCMRMLRRWITASDTLKEIDLEDNLIGDMGGAELLEGLLERKEAHPDFGAIKLRTTHRMKADTLKDLIKLGGGAMKKKKKGGKKKKK